MKLSAYASLVIVSCLASGAFAQSRLLVAEKGAQSLAIIDPGSGKVLASVPEGGITGHEVIASADGKLAFVPVYGNSGVGSPGTDGTNIAVIDIASRKVTGNIAFDHGIRPHCPMIGPKDKLLYVTTELDQTITIIDPKTLKIIGTLPTGQPQSHMLALSHDGRRAYTANVGPGTVSVIDIAARKVLKVIPVSGNTQRISISPDDKWVFTADQTKPQMAVIDTTTNTVAKWIPMEGIGYGSAPTPDGRWLLVALPDQNKVAVIDLKTMQVARTVAVGNYPQEIIVRPDGKSAYISCEKADSVDEIDATTWKVTRTIQTGKYADGLAWAGQ
ncbi:cytochrome D1 domain-containing protein [Telmatobacter sp. DSM 110680]|uniref:Cytochrome D1 domain-containing protein n=1 Tax=Telmatobacter sp. DSM 110680 TaxID=3036704 RepID=A0AAU7DML1_9BACT